MFGAAVYFESSFAGLLKSECSCHSFPIKAFLQNRGVLRKPVKAGADHCFVGRKRFSFDFFGAAVASTALGVKTVQPAGVRAETALLLQRRSGEEPGSGKARLRDGSGDCVVRAARGQTQVRL